MNKSWLHTTGLTAVSIAAMIAASHEGTRYKAYTDVGGVWTICQGHTKGVKLGDVANASQCRKYLLEDMAIADASVTRCIKTAMNVNQQASFDDAVFNVGPRVVCGSTLQRLANAGDITGACEQLSRWVYVGSTKYQGLINRRADDRELCLTEPL